MVQHTLSRIPEVLKTHQAAILVNWLKEQKNILGNRKNRLSEVEFENQSQKLLSLIQDATQSGNLTDINTNAWHAVRQNLDEASVLRAERGFTVEESATFVLSLKQPLFAFIQQACSDNPNALAQEIWNFNSLLDKLGLYVLSTYQKSRELIIKRQQEELLELSTPVLKLWEGILALPMIGTLDSNRTQIIMENLLQKIVEYNCEIAIIDITGVPNVDTLVAQHLLKTVTAARLMGTECIISGIRPQIAQTIVHLGVELGSIITKASLIDAFKKALTMTDQQFEIKPTNFKSPV